MLALICDVEAEAAWSAPHSVVFARGALACALRLGLLQAESISDTANEVAVELRLLIPLAVTLLGAVEQLDVLCGSLSSMRVALGVRIIQELRESCLMQLHCRTRVIGSSVEAGQQLVHLQRGLIIVTPHVLQVVADVAAEMNSPLRVSTAEACLDETAANPDDNIGGPGLLHNARGPEVGEDFL